MQAEPPRLSLPHWLVVSLVNGMQVPVLEQQPVEQVDALQPPVHKPVLQLCPMPQATQSAPEAAVSPHWLVVWFARGMQVPALVQQPAQLDALHPVDVALHWPSWQI
jgi:hypothetical protein